MLIYSKTINLFTKRYEKKILDILKYEVGLSVSGRRFLYENHTYPIALVIFDDEKKWGYFEPSYYKIALNKKLISLPNDELTLKIIKHELAHYLCFIKHGSSVNAHGEEFRNICREIGWGEDIYKATFPAHEYLENTRCEKTLKVTQKIKKLMALQSSSNEYESQLATAKVNELLIKYNIDSSFNHEVDEEEEIFVMRVLHGKRRSAKFDSIAKILNEFFVHTVFSSGTKEFYLEAIGSKLNVKTADYVAKFLYSEFEILYKEAQKSNVKLKGTSAKNNFFYGMAEGFIEKINSSKSLIKKNDLIWVNQKMDRQLQLVYPKLRGTTSKITYDHDSLNIGKKMGQKLNIRPGISSNLKKLFLPS